MNIKISFYFLICLGSFHSFSFFFLRLLKVGVVDRTPGLQTSNFHIHTLTHAHEHTHPHTHNHGQHTFLQLFIIEGLHNIRIKLHNAVCNLLHIFSIMHVFQIIIYKRIVPFIIIHIFVMKQ